MSFNERVREIYIRSPLNEVEDFDLHPHIENYVPARYLWGKSLFDKSNFPIQKRDEDVLFGIELIQFAYSLIEERVLDDSRGKQEQAYYLLAADGFLTEAFVWGSSENEQLQKLNARYLRGQTLKIRLQGEERNWVLLEEIVDLLVASFFQTVAEYTLRRVLGSSLKRFEAYGMGTLLGHLFYWFSEKHPEISSRYGLSFSLKLKERFQLNPSLFINDLKKGLEEYRLILNLPPELWEDYFKEVGFDD